LSEVIVKNGGGRMLEQLLLMSSALRARARSFLMGYIYRFDGLFIPYYTTKLIASCDVVFKIFRDT